MVVTREARISSIVGIVCAALAGHRFWQFRSRCFSWIMLVGIKRLMIVPDHNFQPIHGQIDYCDERNWAARPGKPNPAEETRPEDDKPRLNENDREVDAFYLHPTSLLNCDEWNQKRVLNEAVNKAHHYMAVSWPGERFQWLMPHICSSLSTSNNIFIFC